MKTFLVYFFAYLMRFILWFRYRVTIKGLDKINKSTLTKSGGVLFLPNHPAVFVDPTLVTLALFPKFKIRPMIVEYFYYMPMVNPIMRFLNALPVPNFVNTSNSIKKKKSEQVINTLIQELKNGENFLLYPAGKTKSTGYEAIGGASGAHRIISEVPEANVVLVRTKGLWGSSFSRAITGNVAPMFPTIWLGFKKALKNLLFFTPRRHITIEFEQAPADFPYQASRLEFNRWLERWYNKPDGLTEQKGDLPGDSLVLVSYSMWGKDIPKVASGDKNDDTNIDLNAIPQEVKDKIIKHLSELTEFKESDITPGMSLSSDLGMDSLDTAEISFFLQEEFNVKRVPVTELTTVAKVFAIAAKQIVPKEANEEGKWNLEKWHRNLSKEQLKFAKGETIPEAFLNKCKEIPNNYSCGDPRSGPLTYKQVQLRVLLLAEYFRSLPGEYIGILLPASVAAYITVLAVQFAGKVPMLVNWTTGPRHLDSIMQLSKTEVVLTSWAFLDRLENINLDAIETKLLMLEDIRPKLGLKAKLRAAYRSKKSVKNILKTFGIDKKTGQDIAVLLSTSGTESFPKGVPLSYKNILSNERCVFDAIDFHNDDVLLGMLPPFHAFGFTVTGLLPLLAGLKVVYFPDPTDGKNLARTVDQWGATILCGAPTFLKGILKCANGGLLRSVRLIVSGAEKAPPELFKMIENLPYPVTFLEGYGITECSPILTANMPGQPHIGVGKALPGIEICIVNPDTNAPLPPNTQGMILAAGPNIFEGYLNPGNTPPFTYIEGKKWYRTGDLGFLDKDGNLTITGRLKRFIKIGGEMISLTSIEDTLLAMAETQGCEVSHDGGPSLAICANEIAGEKPRIFLFTKFPTQLEEVNKWLRDSGFSNLVKIHKVIQIAEIPLMGTGKINYRALESTISN